AWACVFSGRESPAERRAGACCRVHSVGRAVDPTWAAEALSAGTNPFTDRERAVLKVALTGASVKVIAARVHLSTGTVRNHLSAEIGKTHTAIRNEAAHIAQSNDLL